MRCFIVLLLFSQIFSIIANELNTEEVIQSLQQDGKVSLSLYPTIYAYESICKNSGSVDLYSPRLFQDVCNVVVNSDLCREVREDRPEDLLKCSARENSLGVGLWEFAKGCTKGVLNSVKDILEFVWSILKWVWGHTTSGEVRGETMDQVSAYASGIKLYLDSEYEKAYAQTRGFFRKTKALKKVSEKISGMMMGMFLNMINNSVKSFGCLNFEAKSKDFCTFIGGIFIPPAGALALIKYGPKVAVKMFPNVERALCRVG